MNLNVPYTGTNGSWEHENYLQGEAIITDSSEDITKPIFAMGDFNCSFGKNGIDEELSTNCQQFLDINFNDPLSVNNNECTFCANNSLTDSKNNLIIDHIFTKNVELVSTTVTKKQKIKLILKDGTKILSNLSDHYGIRIRTKE
jgi:endonuclease/exonuclease/phosphatase family metal-dependent hydrolase